VELPKQKDGASMAHPISGEVLMNQKNSFTLRLVAGQNQADSFHSAQADTQM